MTQVLTRSAQPFIAQQIIDRARIIATEPNSMQRSQEITQLNEQIYRYIQPSDGIEPRCHFFSSDLRESAHLLRTAQQNSISLLAKKVARAVKYLELARKDPLGQLQPIKPPSVPLISLTKALQENDRQSLEECSKKLEQIEADQLMDLFNWARENFSPIILNRLLKKCLLTQKGADQLIETAFEKNAFASISYPIMLHHFHRLSEQSQAKIENWIGAITGEVYQDMASKLSSLIEALRNALDMKRPNYVMVPMVSAQKELEPYLREVSELLSRLEQQAPEDVLDVVSPLWKVFLQQWTEKKSLSEMKKQIEVATQVLKGSLAEMDPARFQKRVDKLIETANDEGAFNHLMILDLMKTLSEDTRHCLFAWADENDDDPLLCYMIEHDLIAQKFLQSAVDKSFKTDSFGLIAGVVNPHKLHLLSEELQRRVLVWNLPTLRRSSPCPRSVEKDFHCDEKVDTTALLKNLHQAIRDSNPDALRLHLSNREAHQLTQEEFGQLIGMALSQPKCLGEILSSPHLQVSKDQFLGVLYEALHQKNWPSMAYLVMSSPFLRCNAEELMPMIELFDGAPTPIATMYQNRLASLMEEQPD